MDVYLERRVGIKPKIQSVASCMHQPPHIRRRENQGKPDGTGWKLEEVSDYSVLHILGTFGTTFNFLLTKSDNRLFSLHPPYCCPQLFGIPDTMLGHPQIAD